MLMDLHNLFRLTYAADGDGGYVVTSETLDWRVNAFLDFIGETMQPAVKERVAEIKECERMKAESKLVGGPFDGEPIEVSRCGGTISRNVRKAWWAVYKRKPGQLPALFVGFATSEAKARTYQLAHATAAAAIKPIRSSATT